MEESLILSEFDKLVKSGTVLYDDKQEIIEHTDGDLKFQFILTSALAKKPTIQTAQQQVDKKGEVDGQRRAGSDIGTAGFEIGHIGSTHFLVVNKFCYARPHLMLLTLDGHQRQYGPLNGADIEATWNLLNSVGSDYVAFYNCGQDGGCSRLHKHMQLMPKPKTSFAAFLDTKAGEEPKIPFQWFHHRFGPHQMTPDDIIKIYNDLLEQATNVGDGRSEHAHRAPPGAACPHNMIITKQWMVVLPRRRGGINQKAGANALGMLGVIAVATRHEINNWLQLGPTDVLRELGVPK
ncbi:hypothetical protein K431DRAFT_339036 [Polychaeton citri CBS 116435]|uniref:ATP adenylyltransferase n=1 Tax=Polychaeton citri CBS 116435 TaxID=1314669 RepID=A0A9P4Q5K2_9PEZI|nr:hypothetical protein K431DRAFT_339036 [Polychaeton citri CBS 116435]